MDSHAIVIGAGFLCRHPEPGVWNHGPQGPRGLCHPDARIHQDTMKSPCLEL